MREPAHAAIIDALIAECDAAAQSGDGQRLRRLHAFLQQTATNYVRLRLTAIDAREPGTILGDAEAIDADSIAADLAARVKQ